MADPSTSELRLHQNKLAARRSRHKAALFRTRLERRMAREYANNILLTAHMHAVAADRMALHHECSVLRLRQSPRIRRGVDCPPWPFLRWAGPDALLLDAHLV